VAVLEFDLYSVSVVGGCFLALFFSTINWGAQILAGPWTVSWVGVGWVWEGVF